MYPALWIAKTGLDAQQTNMSVISNNLSNVNTTGFKRDRAVFNDLIYQNLRQVGAQSSENTELPSGLMVGTGVRVVATQKEHSQGNIVQTGNSLDVAIQGKGYFQVLHPDGNIVYSRDGTFSLTADGNIVTPNGYELQPAMTVPSNATSLTVGSDGVVSALVSGTSTPTQIGQVELAYFVNPQGLEPIGDNLFRETNASGGVNTAIPGNDSTGTLIQGALESSNVNVVEELVNMIETQRAYEMNSKAISTTDEMLSYVNQQL
ncbi:MAG: flagellar basal-body rod protein FlgG [Candidatus Thiodiazotropha lotti]|uniref:Flagellar basal-body rod protein FlgG n=1 Tax=Candidatus Thiodiazotropha endoloripes TaxID=1818881 RepID=A0A1E2UQ52_9GAMM|nr:flagellar basal-body rod protein FlgG [Candidatus Thiodiazotropha endoloripes]MCG7899028.1 flagellar basal-body rod protein FlgG [Candidatus Thiodiazotropha weberae]MCG7992434.1 flagellar basal-body rod protein FlgG [Candidatus Thiodiazotropha lotti]MCG7900783.1 flagellar basal-body rod protein FlgG [Candidatus Thiodiazotropha weberae]MCG7915997.1 flagellar basal-body rod protein FlgG [Candidatus Thiodiazotropha weberae]MCG8001721.1 flagellar basal-body rod protein FlgG [Candidatus Thiodiaz